MDEIRRGKVLAAEILARAAAIKGHMADVHRSIAHMESIEQQAKTRKSELDKQEVKRSIVTDLPSDVLLLIARLVRRYEDVVSLSQTCKRLHTVINTDHAGWEAMAREDWGIMEPHHKDVPCLASILSVHTAALPEDGVAVDELRVLSPPGPGGKDAGSSTSPRDSQPRAARSWSAELALGDLFGSGSSVASSRVKLASLVAGSTAGATAPSGSKAMRSGSGGDAGSGVQQGHAAGSTPEATAARPAGAGGGGAALNSPAASMKPSPWRTIYRDRAQGWRMVRSVLRWQQDHGSPQNVSGSMHRLQLHLALRYMELGTAQPQDRPRRQLVLQHAGLKSLLALASNTSGAVQEMALSVIANLVHGDDEARAQALLGSSMGKLLCEKLSSKMPGVVKQATRALCNMWCCPEVVPEVVPLLPDNRPAVPDLKSGVWQLQEFSLRGDSFGPLALHLTFDSQSRIMGRGSDRLGDTWEDFEVTGQVNLSTRELTMQRRFLGVEHTLEYNGYLDKHGAWGVYASQRSQGASFSFAMSSSRQPRVFRLFFEREEARKDECAAVVLPVPVEGSEDEDAAAGSMATGGLAYPLAWDEEESDTTAGSEDEGSSSEVLPESSAVAPAVARMLQVAVQLAPGCTCGTCWV